MDCESEVIPEVPKEKTSLLHVASKLCQVPGDGGSPETN